MFLTICRQSADQLAGAQFDVRSLTTDQLTDVSGGGGCGSDGGASAGNVSSFKVPVQGWPGSCYTGTYDYGIGACFGGGIVPCSLN